MKSLAFTLSAFIILLAVSCKKSNTPTPATTTTAVTNTSVHPASNGHPTTTIYFAGMDGLNAVYWQNGVEHNLPISDHNGNNFGPVGAYTYNMAIADTDVYITGYNGLNFVYWKNGITNTMPLSLYAQGVAVSGTDVYFAGTCQNDNPLYNLAYLKNGTYNALPRVGISAYIFSTVISGTDVYCAGTDNNLNNNVLPVYWKNGVEHFLPIQSASGNGGANAMFISGTDVYFAGQDGQKAVYWKNGVENFLPMNSNVAYAGAMAISGTDVYFAGVDFRSAVYWKNGVETTLPLASGSSTSSSIAGIAVVGSDVYIAGNEANVNWSNGAFSANVAEYWKNGVVHTLPLTTSGAGTVSAIAVVSQ